MEVEEEEEEEEDQDPLHDIHKLYAELKECRGHHVLQPRGQRLLATWVGTHKNLVCKQCGYVFKGGFYVNHIKKKCITKGPSRAGKLDDEVESPKKKKVGETKAKKAEESAKRCCCSGMGKEWLDCNNFCAVGNDCFCLQLALAAFYSRRRHVVDGQGTKERQMLLSKSPKEPFSSSKPQALSTWSPWMEQHLWNI